MKKKTIYIITMLIIWVWFTALFCWIAGTFNAAKWTDNVQGVFATFNFAWALVFLCVLFTDFTKKT